MILSLSGVAVLLPAIPQHAAMNCKGVCLRMKILSFCFECSLRSHKALGTLTVVFAVVWLFTHLQLFASVCLLIFLLLAFPC